MNEQDKTCKTPLEDLRKSALEHYEEASTAIHHWSSFVEAAIKAYNPDQPEPLCPHLDKNLKCKNMCLTRCVEGNRFWKEDGAVSEPLPERKEVSNWMGWLKKRIELTDIQESYIRIALSGISTVSEPQWYTRQEIYDYLISKDYSKEIAFELAPIWFKDLQGAFKKGWEKAKNDGKAGTFDYEYMKEPLGEDAIEVLKDIMLKFGNAHDMLAKSKLTKEEYQPISSLLAKGKIELFNFYQLYRKQSKQ